MLLAPALCAPAAAHEVRPGFLQLREVAPSRFAVTWKLPARGESRLALAVQLPEPCAEVTPRSLRRAGGAFVERYRVACEGGLAGGEISIEGLAATLTDVLVRIEHAGGGAQVERLTPAAPRMVVRATPTGREVATTYFRLGVAHILTGIDHLLFVLALLMLVRGARRLVATVTCFTLAHSVTLALASLGWVRVSQQPVEAVIALSIVFVALEIVRGERGRPGLTQRAPWAMAFAFGLLHGLGFAGALREIGLPEHAVPVSLLFFNLGVEAGQLAFVAAAVPIGAALARYGSESWPRLRQAPAYAIGSLAAFWTIDRIATFW